MKQAYLPLNDTPELQQLVFSDHKQNNKLRRPRVTSSLSPSSSSQSPQAQSIVIPTTKSRQIRQSRSTKTATSTPSLSRARIRNPTSDRQHMHVNTSLEGNLNVTDSNRSRIVERDPPGNDTPVSMFGRNRSRDHRYN